MSAYTRLIQLIYSGFLTDIQTDIWPHKDNSLLTYFLISVLFTLLKYLSFLSFGIIIYSSFLSLISSSIIFNIFPYFVFHNVTTGSYFLPFPLKIPYLLWQCLLVFRFLTFLLQPLSHCILCSISFVAIFVTAGIKFCFFIFFPVTFLIYIYFVLLYLAEDEEGNIKSISTPLHNFVRLLLASLLLN